MSRSAASLPNDLLAREKVNRYMQELAERAPESVAAHAALLHNTDTGRPIIPAAHHKVWCQMMEDIERYRWVVVICPPGYAKSTWWSIVYPSWMIGRTQGRIRIGLVSNTANLTYGFSRSIMKTISDPRFEMVYGVRPDYSKWSQKQFWTEQALDKANATLMATGIGGPIQGKRFDLIIGDDLTTWEDARSDMVMEGQRLFLKGLLVKRFPPGMGPPDGDGRMVIAMTRWSERDLVPTFEELGFKVLTMPALGYWDRKATCPDCGNERDTQEFALQDPCQTCGSLAKPIVELGEAPLWPEQEKKERLEQEREDDPIIFELVKQGNPRVMGGDVFDTSKLQYAKLPEKESFAEIVQYVDTAGGKDRTKGDYFADVTLGLRYTETGETQVWIMDMDRGRYPATQQEKRVSINAEQWDPILVVVEERNEGIALFQRLCETTRLPVRAYVPVKDKEWRAIQIANAVNQGRVYLPKNEDGSSPAWVRSFVAELDAFPRGPNDDQVDAAAGAYLHTGGAGPKLRVLSATSARAGGRRQW